MSEITPPRVEGTVSVGENRRLAFAEFGPPHGRPVFWLHGTPGARRQIPEAARAAAEELDVNLIGVDRPGVGGSTPHLYGKVLDFATDLGLVADALGFDKFTMIGLSGGGAYVLACAYAMPERVTSVGVLGGVPPTKGDDGVPGGLVGLASTFGPLISTFRVPMALGLTAMVWALRPFASQALDVYARFSPEGDRRVFSRPEIKAMFIDDLLGGSRTGLAAPVFDAVLFGREWGFSVRDIKVPVRWWHGDADHIVSLEQGKAVCRYIPDCQLYVRPGESHLGTLGAAEDILETLLALG